MAKFKQRCNEERTMLKDEIRDIYQAGCRECRDGDTSGSGVYHPDAASETCRLGVS